MLANTCRALRTFFEMRGQRVVKCAETQEAAGVMVDAVHAAKTALAGGPVSLHLRSCSRWPERSNCGQQCVREIEAAPSECLVKNVLKKWAKDKHCVFCKEPLGDVDFAHGKPVLMRPDGTLAEWYEFRPEQIPGALQTHLPVCWSCYVEEAFRKQHPELF